MNHLSNQIKIFLHTPNWRKYLFSKIQKYINGDIIEVGAGYGGNVNILQKINKISVIQRKKNSLIFIEKDKLYFKILKKKYKKQKIYNLTLSKVKKKFDTIIYIDVLEHIQNRLKEIKVANIKLKKKGRIIILCPAYNFLYNEFDRKIGHFLRLDKKEFKILKGNLNIERIFYLDSVGFLLQFINKFIFNTLPKKTNIFIWDNYLIPISKFFDFFFNYSFGKSIVCIYKK